MINLGYFEISFLISLIIFLTYLFEDGKSALRYLALLIVTTLNMFLVLPDSADIVTIVGHIAMLVLMIKRLYYQIIPAGALRESNTKLSSLNRNRYKDNLLKWDAMKSDNRLKLIYCLALILGMLVATNYI